MPRLIVISKSLAGHILLDPELQGRVNVQGNLFETTFGYLNQYLEHHLEETPQDTHESLKTIQRQMSSLVEYEQTIRRVNDSEAQDKDTLLQSFTDNVFKDIMTLENNQSILMPGGWSNQRSSGHAMIYQWTKTRDGILFSIYNSGAGITFHEKISSKTNERFYPVRTHLIPRTFDHAELRKFIKRLLLPQLPHQAPSRLAFNETRLYHDIDTGLGYLDATLVSVKESIPEELTTTSQLSSTCAQRVIHQLLKITFGNLPAYQRFIFKFKMHALREFIALPRETLDKPTIEFIRLAIKHLSKLLKEPGLIADAPMVKSYLAELKALMSELNAQIAIKVSVRPLPTLVESNTPLYIRAKITASEPIEPSVEISRLIKRQPIVHLDASRDLFPQFDELIERCCALNSENPTHVIEQLEEAIVSLPLPSSFTRSEQGDFRYYETIIDHDENRAKMIEYLEQLQQLYTLEYEAHYGENQMKRPAQQITHAVLIGLRDYFHLSNPHFTDTPYHGHSLYLKNIFLSHEHNAFFAAHNPIFDEKFEQLLNLYRKILPQSSRPNENTDQALYDYYKTLITSEAACILKDIYQVFHETTIDPLLSSYLRERDIRDLYALFELFTSYGQFKERSWEKIQHHFSNSPHKKTLLNRLKDDVVQKFIKQIQLEHFLKKSLAPLGSHDDKQFFFPKIVVRSLPCKKIVFEPSLEPLTAAPNNTYSFSRSPEHSVLDQDTPRAGSGILGEIAREEYQTNRSVTQRCSTWSSNRIQLSASRAGTQKETIFVRDLFHLRTAPLYQVQLTLDYFKTFIHTVSDQNTQKYIEANLFERHFLSRVLTHDEQGCLSQIDGFIDRGLQYFSDNQSLMTSASLFFVHLRFSVNHYLAFMHPTLAYHRLEADFKALSLAIHLPYDEAIKANLHQYHFLTAMQCEAMHPGELATAYKEIIHSFFLINTVKIENEINIKVQLERDKYLLRSLLQQMPKEGLETALRFVVNNLLIDVSAYALGGDYPNYYFELPEHRLRYDVDLVSARIFKDNRALGIIPDKLKTQDAFKMLGLDRETTCFLSRDGNTIEFITKTNEVRFQFQGHQLLIEKKWALGGKPSEWHQCLPLSSAQRNLPYTLCGKEMSLWVNTHDQSVVLAQDDHPICQSNDRGELEQLDSAGLPTGFILAQYRGAFHPALEHFEYERFVIAMHQDNHWKFALPRYDLTLETVGHQLQLAGTDYTLSDIPAPFPDSVACLNFSHQHDQMVLVAAQPFEVASDPMQIVVGDYYPVTHNRTETERNIWCYGLQEKYIAYKIIDGTPVPDKPADALYLCYIYLSNHQEEQAWKVLEHIHGLECNYQELVYLEWIVNKLPFGSDSDKEVIKNPRYLTCQLKALSLLTDQFMQDSHPPIPKKSSESPLQKEIRTFYQALPQTIGALLTQFQNMERSLSHPFFLTHKERRSLLNTYQRVRLDDPHTIRIDNQFSLVGTLGYQYQRLSLETLIQEKHHLEAIRYELATQSMELPLKFVKRLHQIKEAFRQELPILKRETKIKAVEIPKKTWVNCYTSFQIDLSILSSFTPESIKSLCSDISEEEFLSHLPSYLSIACNQPKTSQEYQALRTFCMHHLRACAHPDAKYKDSRFEATTNALYLLLQAPDALKIKIKKNINRGNNRQHAAVPVYDFRTLYDDLSSSASEPIIMYQAIDVFETTLATSKQILDELSIELRRPKHVAIIPKPPSSVDNMHAFKALLSIELDGFKDFSERFQQAKEEAQVQFNALLEEPASGETSQMIKDQMAEQQAGLLKFTLAQRQNELSNYFSSPEIVDVLKDAAVNFQPKLMRKSDEAWQEALALANRPPQHETSCDRQALEKLAGIRCESLSKNELLTLYFNQDETRYHEKTGLFSEDINALHQLIHQAVFQSIDVMHINRLIKALHDPKPDDASQIAQILMSETPMDAQNDPRLMLFQYQEDIILRDQQCLALKNLLSSHEEDAFQWRESIEKVIMGGGKSKVILPLLAQKKANGHSLVFIEVPRSLLKTNHTDLNQTSRQLFSQTARCFEFSRESNCTPERLEDIYNQFVESMTNKDYWVTTGESLQSLELKYIELMLAGEPVDAPGMWETQLYWMAKITTLIREFGDVVIDEVHQGLLLKKELNYSLGKTESIDRIIRRLSIRLYRFIDLLSAQHQPPVAGLRGENMRLSWGSVIPTLTTELLSHELSPLRPLVNDLKAQYGEDIDTPLCAYLNNEEEWTLIHTLNPEIQDTLAFYKEQLSSLLPHTLLQKHKVVYGPSDEKRTKNAAEQVIAVPYIANSQPNERSDFGNILTKVNYTIQSVLIDGMSDALLREMVSEWLRKAKIELDKDPALRVIENTSLALGVNHCLRETGFQLQTINIKDEPQMTALLEKVRFNTEFILAMLEQNILEKITVEPDLLHSNAINHVSLYHSAQGLSGTPSNYTTFHERMHFNRNTALGTDGYLIELIKHKKTDVHAIGFTQLDVFLTQLFAEIKRPNPRALIDVGAMFTGIKNQDVAQTLAKNSRIIDSGIRYVLYFNQDNVLCALNIQNQKIETLTSSHPDQINQKLGCTPEQRFTYYDEAHTVGTDLKQATDGTGVVLIDAKTPIQSFLQGAMRMRGLENNQSIEMVVPPLMAALSLDNIMQQMILNEQQQLSEDNFSAATLKLNDLIRNDFIERINALPLDAHAEKERYAKAFKSYFVQINQDRLFDKYGAVARLHNTHELLNDYKIRTVQDWMACLSQLDLAVTPEEKKKMDDSMTKVIASSLAYCQPFTRAQEQAVDQEAETEIQKESQILIEQHKELESQVNAFKGQPKPFKAWTEAELLSFISQKRNDKTFDELQKQCGPNVEKLFSTALAVSDNQALTIEYQCNMMRFALKPVHSILFAQSEQGVKACLITNEEAKQIGLMLRHAPFKTLPIWIGNTQHTVLEGLRPEGVLSDSQYQSLIEQIRFFNGELGLLNQQKEPFQWIHVNSNLKLAFYQEHLARHRLSQITDFAVLEAKVSTLLVCLGHLAAHRLTPLKVNWERSFPTLLEKDLDTINQLSLAFEEVNKQDLFAEPLTVDVLKQRHDLPIDTISALKTHIDIYNERRRLWLRFQSKPNFEKISANQLEICLDLMRIISGEEERGVRLTSSDVVFFFNEISKLTATEWVHLIDAPQFNFILNAITSDKLIALFLNSTDTTTTLFSSLIAKLNFNTLLALIRLETIEPEKKAIIMTHNKSFSGSHLELMLDAIPKRQMSQTVSFIIKNGRSPITDSEGTLIYLGEKVLSSPLKSKLLLTPLAINSLFSSLITKINSHTNRHTSGTHSLKINVLNRLKDATIPQDIDPIYALKTIQAICEHKRHAHNVLWQPQSITEYKQWLSLYSAGALFINNNPPITSKKLHALATSIEPFNLIQQWRIAEQGPFIDPTEHLPEDIDFDSFDNYLDRIRELKTQYPTYAARLDRLINELYTARGMEDIVQSHSACQSAIASAKIDLELETGLWRYLKPILNGILQLLQTINVYNGALFTSEIITSWEEKSLDSVPRKPNS